MPYVIPRPERHVYRDTDVIMHDAQPDHPDASVCGIVTAGLPIDNPSAPEFEHFTECQLCADLRAS